MDSALFIVGSPFQCLCMLEAVDFFKIEQYDVLIPEESTGNNSAQLKALLGDMSIEYQTFKFHHAIWGLLPYVMRKHKYYKNIFLGNYYSPTYEALAVFFGKMRYNLFFIDDGTQALSLFSDRPRYRFSAKKWELYFRFIYGIGRLKGCGKHNFYTIFDVQSTRFNIIKNDFGRLKRDIYGNIKDIYVIGANSSVLKFQGSTYLQLMDRLLEYLHRCLPNQTLHYCPHRRDLNNKEIARWCLNNQVEWYETRVSVEYDFAMTGIYPIGIVGFTSNALYTLNMMYPESKVMTVQYHLESEFSDKETDIIRKEMNRKGIETIEI